MALGEADPTNTSAIIALREAAEQPLDTVRENLYRCLEELANIWFEMMCEYYGEGRLFVGDGRNGSGRDRFRTAARGGDPRRRGRRQLQALFAGDAAQYPRYASEGGTHQFPSVSRTDPRRVLQDKDRLLEEVRRRDGATPEGVRLSVLLPEAKNGCTGRRLHLPEAERREKMKDKQTKLTMEDPDGSFAVGRTQAATPPSFSAKSGLLSENDRRVTPSEPGADLPETGRFPRDSLSPAASDGKGKAGSGCPYGAPADTGRGEERIRRRQRSVFRRSLQTFGRRSGQKKEEKELFSLFPALEEDFDRSALPEEVLSLVKDGVPLAAAYALFYCRGERKRQLAAAEREKNRLRSAGSLGTGSGTPGRPGEGNFTLSEIAAMSRKEVRRYYREIMQSLADGGASG